MRRVDLTFGSGGAPDNLGVGPDVVDYRSLKGRKLEVPSFPEDLIANSTEAVELESAVTRFDYQNVRSETSPYHNRLLPSRETCLCLRLIASPCLP